MTRVAILGLGAMGRRMARRLAAAGHDLTVWSRSGVPDELAELRERAVSTPREAAARAEVVLSVVTDDEASRFVWLTEGTGALAGLGAGAVAVESSTLTPAWVSSLAAQVQAAGAAFLDAPVVGSRPQADAGALVHLVGGAAVDVERARPVLSAMSSAIHHVGATPAGTVAKLAVNALFGVQVAVVGELMGFARRSGIEEAKLLEVMGSLPVMSGAAKVAGGAMAAGKFDPMFPISLVAKDFKYAVTAAEARGAPLPITQRTREVFEQAVAGGLGSENITAIVKLHR